ncbi:hypothetical protein [Microbacterium binotii]|uniref:Uncharacterized protein n=1 Tax=Microbacterium binotii TaxID=462710 RepID=A0ABP6BTI6_9MICO
MSITEADRDAAALHLWDEGLVRPEETGRAVIEALIKLGWSPALPETPTNDEIWAARARELAGDLRDADDEALAHTPTTDDERDALANRLDRKYKLFEKLYADHEHETMVLLRDAVAMLRRPSPPTEEQWEYLAEGGEVIRRKVGPWEPVEAAARVGGEER